MSPVRQAQIVDIIQKNLFSKSKFNFQPIDNNRFNLIYIENPSFYFKMDEFNMCKGCPGKDGSLNFRYASTNWEQRLRGLELWLTYLIENIKVGDPWNEIEKLTTIFSKHEYEDLDTKLNKDEQIYFADKIDQLVDDLNDFKIQNEKILKDMGHLKEMSKSLSKRDIIHLFLGTIMEYILEGLIPADTMSNVIQLLKDFFSGVGGFLNLK